MGATGDSPDGRRVPRSAYAGVMDAGVYRFTELGWLQFERLCLELIGMRAGVAASDWKRHADGVSSVLVERGLPHPLTGEPLPGPVCVVISWWRPMTNNRAAHFRCAVQRAAAVPYEYGPGPMRALLFTNIDAQGAADWGPGDAAQLIDMHGLSAIVDRDPELRRRLPSLLGVRDDLDRLVSAPLLERSSLDHGAARSLARIFVPTPAYARTLDVLQRYGFAVVTGPPEMGKTAIARMIGLAQLTDGWEVHECVRPPELWERFDQDRTQVFIADDAFGSTEYQPESAERWARELDGILRAMDDRHWLIWTSRPAPLRAGLRRVHRERGAERFPQPAQVQVDAAELNVADKALILFRHARAARLDMTAIDLVRTHGHRIVEHRHFTPERIRRFVSGRLRELARAKNTNEPRVAAAVEAEIQEPTKAMKSSFEALSGEHRALLVALLDTPAGSVEEREIVAATRRHSDAGLSRPPGDLIDRLTDHFVRVVPPMSISWVHPSWRDLVIEQLRRDDEARGRFLMRSAIHGLSLALSVEGGTAGERVLPLLITDRDWDTLTDRVLELLPELDNVDLYRLLSGIGEGKQTGLDRHDARELSALTRTILDSTRDLWDDHRGPIPVALLEAWCYAAASVNPKPKLPTLAATWIELLPVGPLDVRSSSDLARWEEWLALVRTLTGYREADLSQFGYPERQRDAIAGLLSQTSRLAECGEAPQEHERLCGLVRQVLELPVPQPAWPFTDEARHWVLTVSEADEPPSLKPVERRAYEAAPSIVERVLQDLEARSSRGEMIAFD